MTQLYVHVMFGFEFYLFWNFLFMFVNLKNTGNCVYFELDFETWDWTGLLDVFLRASKCSFVQDDSLKWKGEYFDFGVQVCHGFDDLLNEVWKLFADLNFRQFSWFVFLWFFLCFWTWVFIVNTDARLFDIFGVHQILNVFESLIFQRGQFAKKRTGLDTFPERLDFLTKNQKELRVFGIVVKFD
jgi:hypothetical protein